jgi:hypothetical protein
MSVSLSSEIPNLQSRVETYFTRPAAQEGTQSLSDGAQIEIKIDQATFTLTRAQKKNQISLGAASSPQLRFELTPKAATELLDDPSDDLGEIGVKMLKLVASPDPERKIHLKIEAGFLTLFTKGYFGILKAGGGPLANYLASRGLGGMNAIKAAFKNRRK